MKSLGLFVLKCITAVIMGNIMALIADGSKMDAMILSMLWLIFYEVRDMYGTR
jgi:hypothetical protein